MANDWLDCLRDPSGSIGRRRGPRVPAPGAFCTEMSASKERYALVSDLSPTGLRLHRPYRGAQSPVIQLEFDLPGIDEVIWAKGEVCFDHVWRPPGGNPRLLQTTGVRLTAAASGHLKLLRDYTLEYAPRYNRYAERRAFQR